MSHTFRYTNPITSDPAISMRDHQILKVGDIWYMTGTAAPYWKGPNPEPLKYRDGIFLPIRPTWTEQTLKW
jgi:hypothetical protein